MVLKFLPLLFVGVVGWFFVSKGNFGAFNASGGSLYSAIGIAAGVALFSFIGVEVSAITAKRVKNPQVNVGRAALLGTAACAILYMATSAAIMGLVPHHTLITSTDPFVPALQAIFTHGTWAGKLVAALAVASGIGALNGWTLVTTEVCRAAAQDGLFPRAFAWSDRKDTAWFGVVMAALLPSLLMLWSYTTKTGLTVFTDLVYLTVVTVAIPYLFSACAQLAYLVSRRRRVQGWALARDLAIAGALQNALPGRQVACLVSRTLVSRDDPAFARPSSSARSTTRRGPAPSRRACTGRSARTAAVGAGSCRPPSRANCWTCRLSGPSSSTARS